MVRGVARNVSACWLDIYILHYCIRHLSTGLHLTLPRMRNAQSQEDKRATKDAKYWGYSPDNKPLVISILTFAFVGGSIWLLCFYSILSVIPLCALERHFWALCLQCLGAFWSIVYDILFQGWEIFSGRFTRWTFSLECLSWFMFGLCDMIAKY